MSSLMRMLAVSLFLVYFMSYGCGRKGDPIPRPIARPSVCSVRWSSCRVLDIQLPTKDEDGHNLIGVEKVRVYYVPMGYDRPTGDFIITSGQVIMEQSQKNVTNLRSQVRLDLQEINYPPGWLTVVAMRVGGVAGVPSETLAWMDSSS